MRTGRHYYALRWLSFCETEGLRCRLHFIVWMTTSLKAELVLLKVSVSLTSLWLCLPPPPLTTGSELFPCPPACPPFLQIWMKPINSFASWAIQQANDWAAGNPGSLKPHFHWQWECVGGHALAQLILQFQNGQFILLFRISKDFKEIASASPKIPFVSLTALRDCLPWLQNYGCHF